ncbi:MAG: ABC transporter permease [Candidatus Bathyarchaeia archaeon]
MTSRNIRVSAYAFQGLWALTNRELKKWYKVPFLIFMSLVQPVLWMGLFGKAMNIGGIFAYSVGTLPENIPPQMQQAFSELLSDLSSEIMNKTFGTADYFSYMAVGMLAFIVLFTAMFSGMSIVWDRRLGFLNKVLTTPVARGAVVMSKVFASVIRSLVQSAVILSLALILGLRLGPTFTPISIIGVFGAMLLLSLGLSSIFITIAIRSSSWETQMAVMNLLNLPLLFASNALFPIALMPKWIQSFAQINPVTHATDAARQLLLYPLDYSRLLTDFAYLGVFATLFTSIGIVLSWRYLSR